MLNLSILVEASAQDYPDSPAVIFNDRTLTYAQLNAAANMFANGLRKLGIGRGDKVAVMIPNLPYFPIAYYGILKTGATVVPFNVLFTAREVAYHLQDSDAAALVGFAMFAEPAYNGFQQVETCKHLIVGSATRPSPSPTPTRQCSISTASWAWAAPRGSTPCRPRLMIPRSSSTPLAPPATPRAPN